MHLRQLNYAGLRPLPGSEAPDAPKGKFKAMPIPDFIIDSILRRERAEREKRRPAQVPLELPLERPPAQRGGRGEEPRDDPNRGVEIIQL